MNVFHIEMLPCNVYGENVIWDPDMFDHTQADIVIDVQHQEKCEQIFEHCLLKENVVMFFFFFSMEKSVCLCR